MSVCNVKVKYIRPRYNNLKEWCEDNNNVYIGRRGIVFIEGVRYPSFDSTWANPFKIDNNNTREEVTEKYRTYIKRKIDSGQISVEQLLSLHGKNLGCWCHPEPCHGDILVELIKEYDI